jgi:hypothetical protein
MPYNIHLLTSASSLSAAKTFEEHLLCFDTRSLVLLVIEFLQYLRLNA